MLKFNELSPEAKNNVVNEFIETLVSTTTINRDEIPEDKIAEFLSFSKIHYYDADGTFIGKFPPKKVTH